jgi:hypothetical protein
MRATDPRRSASWQRQGGGRCGERLVYAGLLTPEAVSETLRLLTPDINETLPERLAFLSRKGKETCTQSSEPPAIPGGQ